MTARPPGGRPGGQGRDRRGVPGIAPPVYQPITETTSAAVLEREFVVAETAVAVLAGHFVSTDVERISPWFDALLRRVINEKIALRVALKAAQVWEADRLEALPFPEEGAS